MAQISAKFLRTDSAILADFGRKLGLKRRAQRKRERKGEARDVYGCRGREIMKIDLTKRKDLKR